MNEDPRNYFYERRYGANADEKAHNQSQKKEENNPREQTVEEKIAQMQQLAKKYEREGEGQLVKDIANSVIEQKARGQLSNEQIVAFAKRIYPLLNAEQKSRLSALVDELVKL